MRRSGTAVGGVIRLSTVTGNRDEHCGGSVGQCRSHVLGKFGGIGGTDQRPMCCRPVGVPHLQTDGRAQMNQLPPVSSFEPYEQAICPRIAVAQ